MRVHNDGREVVSWGVTAKGKFGISRKSQAHIMTILRDNIYTDKILAILREYASNAWDAHRMAGKGDLPIHVTLPDEDSPTLIIRDFGPGMSPHEVFNIYTQYGESTKRDTDDAIGMMGVGSKAAFSYSDSFNVTSWNGGIRRIYVAVLDATNEGDMQCLDERAAGKVLKQFMPNHCGNLDDFSFYDLEVLDGVSEPSAVTDGYIKDYLAWMDTQEILSLDERNDIPKETLNACRTDWETFDHNARIAVARRHAFITFAPTANDKEGVETGIEIQIPIQATHFHDFHTKARILFQYFKPHPIINTTLPTINRKDLTNGFMSSDMSEWIAVMGCVPYRLNLDQVKNELKSAGLWDPTQRIRGGLYFSIGEVHIAASREELKYTDFTRKAIVAKFIALVDEHVEDVLKDIQNPDLSDWEKRIRANFLTHVIGFKLPKEFRKWDEVSVKLWGSPAPNSAEQKIPAPKTFQMLLGHHNSDTAINSVTVTQGGTRIIINDDPRPIKGFYFRSYDYVVCPIQDAPLEAVQAELNEYITSARINGIPVQLLTETKIAWRIPWDCGDAYDKKTKQRDKNPKYWTKAFKLKAPFYKLNSHHSQNWEPAKWEASDNDVYVLLENFEPRGFESGSVFYTTLSEDRNLAQWLGLPFPEIYGYKDTHTSPANKKKIKGLEYRDWIAKSFTDAVNNSPEIKYLIEMMSWVRSKSTLSQYHVNLATRMRENMAKTLGENHAFTVTMNEVVKANLLALTNLDQIDKIEKVIKIIKPKPKSKEIIEVLAQTYPLLFKVSSIHDVMYSTDLDSWIAYIKMCDDLKAYQSADAIANEILANHPLLATPVA